MCGSLMVGMMSGMFNRLRLCQSTDGKDAEHQDDRRELEERVVHRIKTWKTRANPNGDPLGLSSIPLLLIIGFTGRMLYTAQSIFGIIGRSF
jgi:hypothetical protein